VSASLPKVDRTLARRIAVHAQLLDGSGQPPTRAGFEAVVRRLNCLQLDPTNVVARNEYLVPWSRLGTYDRSLLEDASWKQRTMFEYWAHAASLVLTEDFPLHRSLMRAYRNGGKFMSVTRAWVADNRKLRDHVLREIRRDGPVPTNQFTDLSERSYRSGGWNDERNVGRMLDALWTEGKIMVARRDGLRRFWDLSERVLPEWTPRTRLSDAGMWRRRTELALRSLGAGTANQVRRHFMRWLTSGVPDALRKLERDGTAIPVDVHEDGTSLPGRWWVHRDYAEMLDGKADGAAPRTTLLSPFDHLICDRDRTEQLFDLRYRIEIYVPKDKRIYGYFAMPILHGERLVGLVDLKVDRKERTLQAVSVHALPGAPADAGPGLRAALEDLARFCDADRVVVPKDVPAAWRRAVRS
jgi:uncharacterized protein YcaQ